MRIATLRADMLAQGDYTLAQALHAKYELLEHAIEFNSLPVECLQALMEISAAFLDDSELPKTYLCLAEMIAMPDTFIDEEKLPCEFRDDFLQAVCLGIQARLREPRMWDESIRLLEQSLDKPSIYKYPRLRADLYIMLGFSYLSTPSGDREKNLYRAVKCYGEVLLFYSGKPDSWEYGHAQGNLGVAYAQRTTGDRFENLRRVIKC